jgi:hypothetical protein
MCHRITALFHGVPLENLNFQKNFILSGLNDELVSTRLVLTFIEKQHCSDTRSVRKTLLHNAALCDAGTVFSTVM